MKRVFVSLFLIISMVLCGVLLAQNTDSNVDDLTESTSSSLQLSDSLSVDEWTNSIDPFVGVWTLERAFTNDEGEKESFYPGTIMMVDSDANYTIFVFTKQGGAITSKGKITVESPTVYAEEVEQQIVSSLEGVTVKIDYEIDSEYLIKSFRYEKYGQNANYRKLDNEIWKRVKMAQLLY